MFSRLTARTLGLLFGAGLAAGCGSDAVTNPGTGGNAAGAILIAERFSTPNGRIMYMGVFPELPTRPVEISQLTELSPSGLPFACGGNVLYYDAGASAITKYTVGNDLRLTRGQAIQVGQEGIEGFTGALVCASPTRAYAFSETGTRGVEFDPERMVITNAFDLPAVQVEPGLDVQLFEPVVAGPIVYFPTGAENSDSFRQSNRAIVGSFDTRDRSWVWTYFPGCATGLSGYATRDGTFYREPDRGSFIAQYTTEPSSRVPDCVLRIPAGGRQFDPGYRVEVAPTNSSHAIDDTYTMLNTIDPAAPRPPANDPFGWYDLPVRPTRLNRLTGQTQPYTAPTVPAQNSRKLALDARRFYQVNTFNSDGLVASTDLVELRPDGVSAPVLTIRGGDVLRLERVR